MPADLCILGIIIIIIISIVIVIINVQLLLIFKVAITNVVSISVAGKGDWWRQCVACYHNRAVTGIEQSLITSASSTMRGSDEKKFRKKILTNGLTKF